MAVDVRTLDSDAALVQAAQAGDADAFGELFRRHYAAVRRSCARRLRNIPDADEVAQAAFVRAWERIDRCEGERRFGGWVQVIAQNLCVDAQRSSSRVSPVDSAGDGVFGPLHLEPEHALEQIVAADLVRSALADLTPRQRDVVVARDIHGRRPGEIAASFGLSLGAVDSLLLRGRRRLASAVTRLRGEGGVATTSSVSSVVAAAAGSSKLGAWVYALEDGVARASHQLATSFGLVPGVPGTLGRAAASAAALGTLGLSTFAAGSGVSVPVDLPKPTIAVERPATPIAPHAITAAVPLAVATVAIAPAVPHVEAPAAPRAPSAGEPPAVSALLPGAVEGAKHVVDVVTGTLSELTSR